MRISELMQKIDNNYIIRLFNEQEFDRFARTTSIVDGRVCVFVTSPRYINTIPNNATMIITTEDISMQIPQNIYGICISSNPKLTYFKLFNSSVANNSEGVSKNIVGVDCLISDKAFIADHNVIIGNNVIIEEFASVYENVTIGDNTIIRAGARIGIQDYNYFEEQGHQIHLHHYGGLKIGNNVEIGFNTVVGKSLYPTDITVIGDGSKVGANASIGHDVFIDRNVMIYAGVVVAGYASIGESAHITINSSIKNGIKIGNNSMVCMGSNVMRDVNNNETVFGNPAKRMISP